MPDLQPVTGSPTCFGFPGWQGDLTRIHNQHGVLEIHADETRRTQGAPKAAPRQIPRSLLKLPGSRSPTSRAQPSLENPVPHLPWTMAKIRPRKNPFYAPLGTRAPRPSFAARHHFPRIPRCRPLSRSAPPPHSSPTPLATPTDPLLPLSPDPRQSSPNRGPPAPNSSPCGQRLFNPRLSRAVANPPVPPYHPRRFRRIPPHK
jgi:hypothetical protein